MKDTLTIIRRNLLSPIVIAILILSLDLSSLGEIRDAVFLSSVITFNTLIAIIQEVRARRALRKLELMNTPSVLVRLLNNGVIEEVLFDKLNVGDKIILQIGDEVPADGKLITSDGLEVNESILTGESASIEKDIGRIVYAASSIVAGSGTMLVTATGKESRVGQMTALLKQYDPQLTPMQSSIMQLITRLTYGALALAVIIFVVYRFAGRDAITIFKTITSAAVTVVPEGLLLASTLLLAYGSIRLAMAQVLPQKLSAIEAMALLNILCVDKTGTLTSDEIRFEKMELFDETELPIESLVGIVAKETNGGSATGEAIAAGVGVPTSYKILQKLAFSSSRKMSGASIKYKGQTYNIVLGAPENLEEFVKITDTHKRTITKLTSEGKRVLLIASFLGDKTDIKNLKINSGKAVGLIVLVNELRVGVEHTVEYLQKNDVSIRVISGDSPHTVRYVANKLGITNHDKVLTGAELSKIKKRDWDKTVLSASVFARILPEQKEKLVDTFIRLGYFTGMVGDGVNDALAIKKSNLGIAMYSGAAATRKVADMVILDNSFNSLPMGMRLGNKIIQAIELIASLFFHKIIYGVVLLFITLAVGLIYPFSPRHITFMNIFLVTLPTLMWTIFPPSPRHKLSPKYFWRDTLGAVAPLAVLSGIVVALTYIVLSFAHVDRPMDVATITVVVATLMGIYLVFLVPHMYDLKFDGKAKRARLLFVFMVLIFITPSFGSATVREFFDFSVPEMTNVFIPLIAMIIAIAVIQWNLATRAGKRIKQRDTQIIN